MQANPKEILEHYWGYTSFRSLQREIIEEVLAGRDCLALLPTGGGKSLCYQLPALILEGCCLVVSPLLALMENQVHDLQARSIPSEMISADLLDHQIENILYRCKNGEVKILYVSPERLMNKIFRDHAADIHFSFLAVDEAHCISEWGQDFRPSYQHIKDFKNSFSLSCLALTATATPKVVQEIVQKLTLKNPAVHSQSFRRENIAILPDVTINKSETTLQILRKEQRSGIIYCATRKEVEFLADFLKRCLPDRVNHFHAGLSPKEKKKLQQWWLQSDKNVLVSTNAFGMGIDKGNVRFIVHYSPARTLENYYQEIGRAGRDGLPAAAYLLWSPTENQRFDDILMSQIPSKKEFSTLISHLYSHYGLADGDENVDFQVLKLQQLIQTTRMGTAKVQNILQFLQQQEIIYYQQTLRQGYLKLLIPVDEMDHFPKKDQYFAEVLVRTVPGCQHHQTSFSIKQLSDKLQVDQHFISERLKELAQKQIIDYSDGNQGILRFLKPRDQAYLERELWPVFKLIQENKIRKWEEMKYYLQEDETCRMVLIQRYFGEKNTSVCGKCNICRRSRHFAGGTLSDLILNQLSSGPQSLETLHIHLMQHDRAAIRDQLIVLLNEGRISMHSYNTYRIS